MLKVANSVINASRITGVLPVANGGTGVTTSTGTGNTVLSATPTLSGDVTLSTGNLVIGTSGKGIDFSATSGTGTSELLADYEEGTWTPIDASSSGLTFTGVSGYYTKIGNMVFATFALVFPATSSSALNVIGGLPFTTATGDAMNAFNVSYTSYTPGLMSPLDSNATTFTLYDTTTTNAINNTALVSKLIRGTCIYKVA